MKLTAHARQVIREYGFTVAEFARMQGYPDGKWGGDICGCTDTGRCANGFHHDGTDDCGCLPVLLDQAVAWRAATRWPDSVDLTAPYDLFRCVTVSTPGVLATVSASAGGIPAGKPPESVVRLEVREGWTAETATDDNGRIVIRIMKAQEGAGTSSEDGAR